MIVMWSLEHLFDIKKKQCWLNMDFDCVFRMRFEDLRDKQVEKSGVGGIRRDGGIASIHEDMVPGGAEQWVSEVVLTCMVFRTKTLNTIHLICSHSVCFWCGDL